MTLDNTPESIKSRLPKTASVHCILAVSLLLDRAPFVTEWKKAMPAPKDIFNSMPIAWDVDMSSRLPRGAIAALDRQRTKFSRDLASAQVGFPEITREDFLYSWLLVNTRSFHHATTATKNRPSKDQMILQPVADLFNHEPSGGCRVVFDKSCFSATVDRSYAAGEEVTFCYGSHSNDTLLVEYGFVADNNKWDEVVMDDAIVPRLSDEQITWLEEFGMFGHYCIDNESACYRIEAAIRATFLTRPQWTAFARGEDDGQDSRVLADGVLKTVIVDYDSHVQATMASLSKLGLIKRHPLFQRWSQVALILQSARLRLVPYQKDIEMPT